MNSNDDIKAIEIVEGKTKKKERYDDTVSISIGQ